MDIPREKQFHFHDGTAVASLDQLKHKIESISYQEFYRHVNAEKNDFANWIRHVLKDERLAEDLQKVGSIVETVEILEDYIRPRPVLASHRDIQSRIEESVIKSPLPALTEDSPTVIEQSARPTSVHNSSHDVAPIDLRIIEEKLGLREGTPTRSPQPPVRPPTQSPQPKDLLSDAKVRDELFGTEDSARATLASERKQETRPVPEHALSDSDMTRIIVKDFIYGLVFGLVLGLVLGRIISI